MNLADQLVEFRIPPPTGGQGGQSLLVGAGGGRGDPAVVLGEHPADRLDPAEAVPAWTALGAGAAGLRFDAFAAQHANGPLPPWTLWGGNTPHQPTWTIHLSTHTPAALLHDLTYELAHAESTHELPDPSPHQAMPRTTGAPLPGQPVAPPTPPATRTR
ncbi:DUF317 domain-containing protein [Streptomyces uncialis]|uniref:DUF317 domain-containing protein n=1 Tax=Streptomyces uncialis TaxID=1048205 RepID=UPI00364A9097